MRRCKLYTYKQEYYYSSGNMEFQSSAYGGFFAARQFGTLCGCNFYFHIIMWFVAVTHNSSFSQCVHVRTIVRPQHYTDERTVFVIYIYIYTEQYDDELCNGYVCLQIDVYLQGCCAKYVYSTICWNICQQKGTSTAVINTKSIVPVFV